MISLTRPRRQILRDFARAGVVLSAAMMAVSFTNVLNSDRLASAATGFLGPVQLLSPTGASISGGGSGTEFSMTPPVGASCEGSGAGVPAYRWQTYMVSASVDVATLAYAAGPKPVAGAFVSPLFDSVSVSPVINKNPAASPLGLIQGIPVLSFAAFAPAGTVPAGVYKLGFACTKAGVTDSYWTSQITVVVDAAELPSGFTWSVTEGTPPGTTTTFASVTTTTTVGAATSTSAPKPTTTTTVAGAATTSTVAGSTTTSTVAGSPTTSAIAGATTTSIGFGSGSPTPTTTPNYSSSGTIPYTGASPLPFAVWAVLLLVFGRMAILFARPARVLPPAQP